MQNITHTVLTLIIAGTIGFASTVSAVHVHDIINRGHQETTAVHVVQDTHHCIFCCVIYQSVTSDASFPALGIITPEILLTEQDSKPLKSYSSYRYGRAPPLSA